MPLAPSPKVVTDAHGREWVLVYRSSALRPVYQFVGINCGACAVAAAFARPVPPVLWVCAGVSLALLAFAAIYLAIVDPSALRSQRFDPGP